MAQNVRVTNVSAGNVSAGNISTDNIRDENDRTVQMSELKILAVNKIFYCMLCFFSSLY